VLSGARAQVTCRSRYTEESLARGLRNGISQYVILGAGLDSFAWRSRLAAQVRVFEVDHPATQEWKRQVRPALSGVIFVPVDFTSDSLGERLAQAHFDITAAALVSWLGITMDWTRTSSGRSSQLSAASRRAPSSSSTTCSRPGSGMPRATPTPSSLRPAELSRIAHAAVAGPA
jgi:methyltransferase (TIGR00027 family)